VGSRTSLQIGSGYCKRVEGIVTVTGLGSQGRDRQDRRHETSPEPHYRHRFAAEIIGHAVWLYQVFSLSLRDVELLLAERASSSAMRPCGAGARNSARRLPAACATAGHGPGTSGTSMRSSSSSSENRGVQHDLWRAVDQDGVVLDILVQDRRDSNAAKRFFRRLLKGLQYVPRVIVTDKPRSYGAA